MKWIVEAETLEDMLNGNYTIGTLLTQCKDCKWWDTDYGEYGYCSRHGNRISTYKEGYCHMAKRREE